MGLLVSVGVLWKEPSHKSHGPEVIEGIGCHMPHREGLEKVRFMSKDHESFGLCYI